MQVISGGGALQRQLVVFGEELRVRLSGGVRWQHVQVDRGEGIDGRQGEAVVAARVLPALQPLLRQRLDAVRLAVPEQHRAHTQTPASYNQGRKGQHVSGARIGCMSHLHLGTGSPLPWHPTTREDLSRTAGRERGCVSTKHSTEAEGCIPPVGTGRRTEQMLARMRWCKPAVPEACYKLG